MPPFWTSRSLFGENIRWGPPALGVQARRLKMLQAHVDIRLRVNGSTRSPMLSAKFPNRTLRQFLRTRINGPSGELLIEAPMDILVAFLAKFLIPMLGGPFHAGLPHLPHPRIRVRKKLLELVDPTLPHGGYPPPRSP
jgi:hypothetical protein